MGITGLATLLMASLSERGPGITATTAAGITAGAGMVMEVITGVADTAAQDTAGIIAAATTIAMGTEATGGDTLGAAIATDVVGMIVDTAADT